MAERILLLAISPNTIDCTGAPLLRRGSLCTRTRGDKVPGGDAARECTRTKSHA